MLNFIITKSPLALAVLGIVEYIITNLCSKQRVIYDEYAEERERNSLAIAVMNVALFLIWFEYIFSINFLYIKLVILILSIVLSVRYSGDKRFTKQCLVFNGIRGLYVGNIIMKLIEVIL